MDGGARASLHSHLHQQRPPLLLLASAGTAHSYRRSTSSVGLGGQGFKGGGGDLWGVGRHDGRQEGLVGSRGQGGNGLDQHLGEGAGVASGGYGV